MSALRQGQFQVIVRQIEEHDPDCRLRAAVTCPVGVECRHGYDVCPVCDQCTCEWVEIRMTLDDLVSAVTEEKLRAGKVLIYNPGRHAPLKVSIWWKPILEDEAGPGVYGVNLVTKASNKAPEGRTLIFPGNFEAAKVGFKSACEKALVLWTQKTLQPHKIN